MLSSFGDDIPVNISFIFPLTDAITLISSPGSFGFKFGPIFPRANLIETGNQAGC